MFKISKSIVSKYKRAGQGLSFIENGGKHFLEQNTLKQLQ